MHQADGQHPLDVSKLTTNILNFLLVDELTRSTIYFSVCYIWLYGTGAPVFIFLPSKQSHQDWGESLHPSVGNDQIKHTSVGPLLFLAGCQLHAAPVISPLLGPDLSIRLLISVGWCCFFPIRPLLDLMTWERIDELPDLFFLLRLGHDGQGFGLVSGNPNCGYDYLCMRGCVSPVTGQHPFF